MYTSATGVGGKQFGRLGLWLGHFGPCLVLAERPLVRHHVFSRWKYVPDEEFWIATSGGADCEHELDAVFDSVEDLQYELNRLGAVEYEEWDANLAQSYFEVFKSRRLRKEILTRIEK